MDDILENFVCCESDLQKMLQAIRGEVKSQNLRNVANQT